MSNNINDLNHTPKNKVFAGVILLAVGAVLLVKQLNFFFFPDWLISWPMLLIVWGLYSGAKHNFRKPIWFILIIVGLGFLADDAFPDFDMGAVVWPVILISFGLWIIMKRNRADNVVRDTDYWDKKYKASPYTVNPPETEYTDAEYTTTSSIPPVTDPLGSGATFSSHDDVLDAVAVFGGVNKTILSKNFRGGEIVNVFGGTEIDFTQADINGRVVIEITQVFGGTKIIVPANWHVVPDLSAVFAGIDDKRIKNAQSQNSNKVLVLKGVSIFAGVDIRSY
jgi:predicted membrane protein